MWLGPATADHAPEPGESASRVVGPQVPACAWEGSGVIEEDGVLSVTAWPFPVFRSPVLAPEPCQAQENCHEEREAVLWGLEKSNCALCVAPLVERMSIIYEALGFIPNTIEEIIIKIN